MSTAIVPAQSPAEETTATVTRIDGRTPRYAENAAEIAQRLEAATRAGWTRPALMRLTGMGGSAVWRCQMGRIHTGEVDTVLSVLTRIEAGELVPETRKTSSRSSRVEDLEDRLRKVDAIIEQALATKTRRDVDRLLGEARVLILGSETETPENAG